MAAKYETVPRRRTHPDVVAFIAALEAPQRKLVKALRQQIRAAAPDAKEGIYWGVPFFFRKEPFAYISPARRHVTLGFTRGAMLEDPSGLLTGTSHTPVRKATLPLGKPVPQAVVASWIQQAVALDEELGPG